MTTHAATAVVVAEPDAQLQVLHAMEQKLAAITTVDDGKALRDQVAAVTHLLKLRGAGLAVRNQAALFKSRIEHRLGGILNAVPKAQGKRDGTDGLLVAIKRSGCTVWAAYRWMKLAGLPESALLDLAANCTRTGEELTDSLVHDVLVRRWEVRHGAGPADPTAPPSEGATGLLDAKRELEEWEVLDPGALDGLSDLEVRTLVPALRKAYDLYCEDPARGKVPAWTEPPDAKRLHALWDAHPSEWQEDGGWYPPFTVDRRCLRYLAQLIIADLKAGRGAGYRDVARRLDLARLPADSSSSAVGEPPSRPALCRELVAAALRLRELQERFQDSRFLFPDNASISVLLVPNTFTIRAIDDRLVIEWADE